MSHAHARALILAGAVLALAGTSHGSIIGSALIREADLLPGRPDLTISSIGNSAVNTIDGWAFSINTQDDALDTFSIIWGDADGVGPGGILQQEATIGDLRQTAFESFHGLADDGSVAYSASGEYVSSGDTFDSVWVGNTKVTARPDAVPTLPGRFTTFASRPNITADGTPVWVGGVTDTQGSSATQTRVLYSGFGMDVVLKGGDFVPGVSDPMTMTSGIDFDFRFSRGGTNYITPIDVDAPSSTDGVMVVNGQGLVLDGTLVREGNPIPASISPIAESWDNFDFTGVNEAGDTFFTGDTDGPTATDEFVAKNGQLVQREGDAVTTPLGPGVISGAIEGGYMNEGGDWAVVWDADVGGDNLEMAMANGEVFAIEGQAVDWNGDGIVDAGDGGAIIDNFTGISSLTVGERDGLGRFDVYVTIDVRFPTGDVLEGGFVFTVPSPGAAGLLAVAAAGLAGRRRR
jgi:hypothetical protein